MTTTYVVMDNSRPLSGISRQETTSTTDEPLDEQLPSETAPRDDYLTFDSSPSNTPMKSDNSYQKLNIDTQQQPSVYEETTKLTQSQWSTVLS